MPAVAAASATTSADFSAVHHKIPPLPGGSGGGRDFYRPFFRHALQSMDPPLYSRKIPKGLRSKDTSTAAASSDAARDAAAPGRAACFQAAG